MWVAEGVTEIWQRVQPAPLIPIGPLFHTQHQSTVTSVTPPWWIPKTLPLTCHRCAKTHKKMAQMKEQIKAPEKIQLSNKEIANLSDAQFKTLVIRKLTELVEFGRNLDEKNEGYAKRNKGKCTGNQ